jgi:hypothetical protein
MNTLPIDKGTVMINLIMARTFLAEAKSQISKMTAAEYNYSDLIGHKEMFGKINVVLSSKSKSDALGSIKINTIFLNEEISKLEMEYEPVIITPIETSETKKECSGDELLALFIGKKTNLVGSERSEA